MDMIYLITSSFGIGEQLILKLIENQESVFSIFSSPKEVPMSFLGKTNLKYGFLKFEHDVDLSRVLPKRIKYCIHLHDAYSGSFTTMFKANPCGTLSLLDWARRVQVERFIYISSGEVYGQGQKVDERTAFNPHSFYATTKFETEYLFRYFHNALSISTIRLFFPFGKGVRTGLIPEIVEAIDKGKSFETGYHTISPTYADDVVGPLHRIINKKGNTVYNICGSPVEVAKLVEDLGRLMGKTPQGFKIGKTVLTGSNAKVVQDLAFKETPLDKALDRSYGRH